MKTAAANKLRNGYRDACGSKESPLYESSYQTVTTPTDSLWAEEMASSFSSCWKGLCHELSCHPTPRPGKRPESVPGHATQRSGARLGQSLPRSPESPQRCRNHLAQLCLRFAPFPALVGGGESHHRHHRKSPRRIRLARLYPLPDQSTAATRRRQYQSPRGHCRTGFTAGFPGCPVSFRSRLSVRLLASVAAQRRTFSSRIEPVAHAR